MYRAISTCTDVQLRRERKEGRNRNRERRRGSWRSGHGYTEEREETLRKKSTPEREQEERRKERKEKRRNGRREEGKKGRKKERKKGRKEDCGRARASETIATVHQHLTNRPSVGTSSWQMNYTALTEWTVIHSKECGEQDDFTRLRLVWETQCHSTCAQVDCDRIDECAGIQLEHAGMHLLRYSSNILGTRYLREECIRDR